jgi:hypothetical protein
MIDVTIPPYASDYDGYILIKFFSSQEYQQQFLNGEVFFNTVDSYACSKQAGISDITESQDVIFMPDKEKSLGSEIAIIDGQPCWLIKDYSKSPNDYQSIGSAMLSCASNRQRKAICLYTLFVNSAKNMFEPFSAKMKENHGNFAVLITNRQEFFKRVDVAIRADRSIIAAKMGFVTYEEIEGKKGITDWDSFQKPLHLAYQNEFRISIRDNTMEPKKVYLERSIRDIAVALCAEKLYTESYMKNRYFYYPIK